MDVTLQPRTREAFAPFGDVIDIPDRAGRTYYEDTLGNLRPGAHSSLSVSLKAETLERHEFSSQTFVPIDVQRWLVVMAPHAAPGGPDLGRLRVFIATRKQGVTYKPNTWHDGLTVLDWPGCFAVFMWRDGSKGDEEFVPVRPFMNSHSLTAEARP